MHGGLPPADVFPLTAVEYTFRVRPAPLNGAATASTAASPVEQAQSDAAPINGRHATAAAHTPSAAAAPAGANSARIDDPATLAALQQYNLSFDGFPPLREWLVGLMRAMQVPAHPRWDVLLANGALHSIELVLRTFLEPGDTVYVEEFAFSQVPHPTALVLRTLTRESHIESTSSRAVHTDFELRIACSCRFWTGSWRRWAYAAPACGWMARVRVLFSFLL